MTLRLVPMDDKEVAVLHRDDAGLGALQTERGNLALDRIDAAVTITGLVSRIELTQDYVNPHDVALEATYIFPLPDRAAVTAMVLTADGRSVRAELRERGAARADYEQALAAGQRAAITEEERPDVFTMRVGNIAAGERVTVALTLVGPLSYEDGEATFRLPLVVAPRYIPGQPSGNVVGAGSALDTDAVPDASRITPPVLLPGFPNPVRLSIAVDIDPAGLPLDQVRSSLHAVVGEGRHLSIQPGERANRDFILRLSYGEPAATTQALNLSPDADGDQGTFRLTVLPPVTPPAGTARPRDVVLVLDRSGSMMGWKMVAARRAAARIVDTLTADDRFAVIAFDDRVDYPDLLGPGLHPATDRNRFQAVGFLSTMVARGGTELLTPLRQALGLLTDANRDRVVVLVTDGQVGNEDQILRGAAGALAGVRVHTVGVDQAVNAGFLGRLAAAGRGRCELVESEDRLDAAMDQIHRRIGAPLVTGLTLATDGLDLVEGTVTPARLPDLFVGAPLVVTGRYRRTGSASGGEAGNGAAAVVLAGRTRPGHAWQARVPAATAPDPAVGAIWARAYLRDLEDRYVSEPYGGDQNALEQRIVATSVRFGVLCRFTAWIAIDDRVVSDGGPLHHVVQPVESPAGWPVPAPAPAMMMAASFAAPKRAQAMSPRGRSVFGGRRAAMPSPAAGGWDGAIAHEAAPGAAPDLAVAEGATPTVPDSVRQVAAAEAQRLRDSADAPDYERRELLADLGTRLAALARELGTSDLAASVRALATELSDERLSDDRLGDDRLGGAELGELWDRALAVLDQLASPDRSTKKGKSGGAFWKRG